MIACYDYVKSHIVQVITLALFILLPVSFTHATLQGSPTPDQSGKNIQPAPLPQLNYSRDDAYTGMTIVRSLERYHYSRKKLDDVLSAKILDKYLSTIDPAKNLFTQKDIKEFEQVKYWLDNSLERGNLNPGYVIFNIYLQRSMQRLQYIKNLIPGWKKRFNFTQTDFISLDRDNDPWPETMADLKTLWYRELKNDILTRKLDGVAPDEITTLLEKRYHNRQTRLVQIDEKDVFSSYMNAVTMSFDPHTQYFPPRASEDFDIQMSLSLEGIGAVLQTEDEYTKVVRLITAGPADKSGRLKPGDKIMGVGQGLKGEIQDTVGWRIDEVVKLIRGPRNTIVRLEIIPADKKGAQHAQIIVIKRDEVKLEEQAARKRLKTIIQGNTPYKIGIIELPTFYLDFKSYQEGKKDYRSTTRDVLKLIKELKKENIDGLVMDLRDNGGGSLQEVNDLTGLFIKEGPTVQIRSRNGDMSQMDDPDPAIQYRGPLMVMINRMSASASEIFAGAIKDYHRGVIVGTQTFGKGTVQAMQSLGSGQLKLTSAKFYRISGKSTQNHGVLPDIEFPPLYNSNEIGESALDNALPWDRSPHAEYRAFRDMAPILPLLQKKHHQRIAHNPDFKYLNEKFQRNTEMFKIKALSLNEAERKNQTAQLDKEELDMENRYRTAKGLAPIESVAALKEQWDAEEKNNDDNDWEKKDLLLVETTHLMADFIAISRARGYKW
ncbi:carboxyl-terminal processing protease [Desulfocicer vacuolatum DSM 3385]|uniref:Carboxyl-terminal processing protease n=1 Tax=Desulfocicer vacuolatum DSM 3385 TaxID=1121400 RepID=A0A1W2D9T9_9BACT|nr:carboxy terminal-processing peptidase [Desulfocicer vacuolatum]SMC93872.1 carboxyl-terminal processing protease [Desulfocicer vacuolatum DSM 3385]